MTYIEHFNEDSEKYLRFRPSYPEQLFDYLSTIVNEKAHVWDCGTGSGHYRTIVFPFKPIRAPHFTIEKKFDFSSLLGYLNTWSAVKEYKNRQHTNPIEMVYDHLLSVWGNPKSKRVIRWRIYLLVGRID